MKERLCILVVFLNTSLLYGQNLQYPELSVVPRATDLLNREVKNEKKRPFSRYKWNQVASLLALTASYRAMAESSTDSFSTELSDVGSIGMAISGSTLLMTLGLDLFYRPYRSGLKSIRKISSKGRRGFLERQRFGEEVLREASNMSSMLNWATFLSHSALAGEILSKTKNVDTKVISILAILGSALPVLFDNLYERNWSNYTMYKKRIYGPISGISLMPIMHYRSDFKLEPGFSISLYL